MWGRDPESQGLRGCSIRVTHNGVGVESLTSSRGRGLPLRYVSSATEGEKGVGVPSARPQHPLSTRPVRSANLRTPFPSSRPTQLVLTPLSRTQLSTPTYWHGGCIRLSLLRRSWPDPRPGPPFSTALPCKIRANPAPCNPRADIGVAGRMRILPLGSAIAPADIRLAPT